ncbi:hypothetical protein ACHQM5_007977 [Ranunculus cassubicifolius]
MANFINKTITILLFTLFTINVFSASGSTETNVIHPQKMFVPVGLKTKYAFEASHVYKQQKAPFDVCETCK